MGIISENKYINTLAKVKIPQENILKRKNKIKYYVVTNIIYFHCLFNNCSKVE